MPIHEGSAAPAGDLGLRVIRGGRSLPAHSRWPLTGVAPHTIGDYAFPTKGLPDAVNAWRAANRPHIRRGLWKLLTAQALRIPHMYGQLFLTLIHADGEEIPLGLASCRLVTTAGVRYICDDMNAGTTDVTNLKYHGFGVGTTAEAVGDTALVTEETTQYATDNTRPTGTQASATVTTNATYTTVGTYSPDSGTSPRPITEHGIFSQAATGGGTLLDRSVFSVVNLVTSADSLQATYVFTLNSGG